MKLRTWIILISLVVAGALTGNAALVSYGTQIAVGALSSTSADKDTDE